MLIAWLAAGLLLLCATVVGRAVLVLAAPRAGRTAFFEAAAPLIGLATLLAILDLVVLVLPLRLGAWFVPLVFALSLVHLAVRGRRGPLRVPRGDVAASIVGLAMGGLPLIGAGRATVVALTNDDATYYLAAAERLVSLRWLDRPGEGTGLYCLSEQLIHSWLWRTGVPNLIGTSATLFRVDGTVGVAIVTMLLSALVAHAGIAVALALGSVDRARVRALIGATVVLSAAPAFLAWQHLLGQLFAFSFFPVALAGLAVALEDGDARQYALAALLLGAGMNGFADAAVVLILGALMVVGFGRASFPRRVGRLVLVGAAAVACFPATAWRAVWAAYGTVAVRAKQSQGVFVQRGWLHRGPLDDFATLFSVDPWPPWPAPFPPTPASLIELAATFAAVALLLSMLIRARHRRGVLLCATLAIATVIAVMIGVENRYLRAKWLLLDAAVALPAIASTLGRSRNGRWEQAALGVWAVGSLSACAQLARPSGFHVVDTEDHDRLVRELAKIPPGSLFVLDGFGAPSDVVHDEHRAFRAAHRAGLVPIQPGLDGGFFKPRCTDPLVTTLPPEGWALQRVTSEVLSHGEVVARFGDFALRRANLTQPGAVIGAWAPTHGFLRAEREPDGTVFRWAERSAAGVLHVITASACGRLVGEVRSVSSEGTFTLASGDQTIAIGAVTPKWTPFRSALFAAIDAVPVRLEAAVAAPDDAHAIATRKLSFQAEASCATAVARANEAPRDDLFPEVLEGQREYAISAATGVHCGVIAATIDANREGGVVVIVKDSRRFTAIRPGITEARSLPVPMRDVSAVAIRPVVDDGTPPFKILALRLLPSPCGY